MLFRVLSDSVWDIIKSLIKQNMIMLNVIL